MWWAAVELLAKELQCLTLALLELCKLRLLQYCNDKNLKHERLSCWTEAHVRRLWVWKWFITYITVSPAFPPSFNVVKLNKTFPFDFYEQQREKINKIDVMLQGTV